MVKTMLGVADIAAMFGVEPKTVSIWRQRYADFPEPDIQVGETAGWDPGRAEEIHAWKRRRPGRGRDTVPTAHTQEVLRRIFVYKFMRPDDFAWAPIDFPGVRYDDDGMLGDGMRAKGAAHLLDAIRQQGYDLVFDDPATDPAAALHHVFWDKWTEDEVGEHQFIGRLFNERGQIYQGCTAFDAATYTIQRLAALGGDIRPAHPTPGSVTAAVAIEPAGRGSYVSESGYRVVVTPINSPYPLSYKPGSRYGATPKYWLIVGVPPQACKIGSIIHTRHINGTATATIDWQVVDPGSTTRNIPRWIVKKVESTTSQ